MNKWEKLAARLFGSLRGQRALQEYRRLYRAEAVSDEAVIDAIKSVPEHFAAVALGMSPGNIGAERIRMGRSPAIWKNGGGTDFGLLSILEDSGQGDFAHNEFMSWVGAAVASNKNNYFGCGDYGWHSLEGGATAGSITSLATDFPVGAGAGAVNGVPPQVFLAKGAIELATGAAAHNSCAMEAGGSANGANANGMYALPTFTTVTAPIYGQYPKIFFEARVRFPQSANTSVFIGLCTPNKTSAMNTIFSAADVAAAMDAIGFWVNAVAGSGYSAALATSATQIQAAYGSNGGAITLPTQANVAGIPSTANYIGNSAAVNPVVAGLATDWTKIGFVFDANRADSKNLMFFQDGIPICQLSLAQIVAANWPSKVQLTPTVYVQSTGAGGATSKLDIDWIDVGIVMAAPPS